MLFNIADAIYYPRIPQEKEHQIGNHLRSLETGLPPFTVLLFTVLYMCCAFYKWKARLSTSKNMQLYCDGLKLNKPAASLRYACTACQE